MCTCEQTIQTNKEGHKREDRVKGRYFAEVGHFGLNFARALPRITQRAQEWHAPRNMYAHLIDT